MRVLHETEEMSVAAVGPLCIGRWRRLPDADGFQAMHATLKTWAAGVGPFVAINVVDLRAMLVIPDPMRAEIAKVQKSFDGQQLGLATVVPERGFFAAAVRAVVGAVQLLSGTRYPQKVFASVDEAVSWANDLYATVGVAPVHVDDVIDAFAALRDRAPGAGSGGGAGGAGYGRGAA